MAYVKQNWECGEMITADKLNHMEDGIAAGSDCDCGFECTEVPTTLTEETLTTAEPQPGMGIYTSELSYETMIDTDTLIVTFGNTEYECECTLVPALGYCYGADVIIDEESEPPFIFDFSNYPFLIASNSAANSLVTETAGTYTVKLEAIGRSATVTDCFAKAVGLVVNDEPIIQDLIASMPLKLSIVNMDQGDEDVFYTYDHTWQEVNDALDRGAYVTYQTIATYNSSLPMYVRIFNAYQANNLYLAQLEADPNQQNPPTLMHATSSDDALYIRIQTNPPV